jgi:hypothetical protein
MHRGDTTFEEIDEFIREVAEYLGRNNLTAFRMTWPQWATAFDIASTRVWGVGPQTNIHTFPQWIWDMTTRVVTIYRWQVPHLDVDLLHRVFLENDIASRTELDEVMAYWIDDFPVYLRESMMWLASFHMRTVSWDFIHRDSMVDDFDLVATAVVRSWIDRGITSTTDAQIDALNRVREYLTTWYEDDNQQRPQVQALVNLENFLLDFSGAVGVWLSTQGWPAPVYTPPEPEPILEADFWIRRSDEQRFQITSVRGNDIILQNLYNPDEYLHYHAARVRLEFDLGEHRQPEPEPVSSAVAMQTETWQQFEQDMSFALTHVGVGQPEWDAQAAWDGMDERVRLRIETGDFLYLRNSVEAAAAMFPDDPGTQHIWEVSQVWEYRNDDFPVQIEVWADQDLDEENRALALGLIEQLGWTFLDWVGLQADVDVVYVQMPARDVVNLYGGPYQTAVDFYIASSPEDVRYLLHASAPADWSPFGFTQFVPDEVALEDFRTDREQEGVAAFDPTAPDAMHQLFREWAGHDPESLEEIEQFAEEMAANSPSTAEQIIDALYQEGQALLPTSGQYWVHNATGIMYIVTDVQNNYVFLDIVPPEIGPRVEVAFNQFVMGYSPYDPMAVPDATQAVEMLRAAGLTGDVVPPEPEPVTPRAPGARTFTGTPDNWERMTLSPMEPGDVDFRQGVLNELHDRVDDALTDTLHNVFGPTWATVRLGDDTELGSHRNQLVNFITDVVEDHLDESSTGVTWARYVRQMRVETLRWIAQSDYQVEAEEAGEQHGVHYRERPEFDFWLRDRMNAQGATVFDIPWDQRNIGAAMVHWINFTTEAFRAYHIEFADSLFEGGVIDYEDLDQATIDLSTVLQQVLFDWTQSDPRNRWTPGQPVRTPEPTTTLAPSDVDLILAHRWWETDATVQATVRDRVWGWIDSLVDEANDNGEMINDSWEAYTGDDVNEITNVAMDQWPGLSAITDVARTQTEEAIVGVGPFNEQDLLDHLNEIVADAVRSQQVAPRAESISTPAGSFPLTEENKRLLINTIRTLLEERMRVQMSADTRMRFQVQIYQFLTRMMSTISALTADQDRVQAMFTMVNTWSMRTFGEQGNFSTQVPRLTERAMEAMLRVQGRQQLAPIPVVAPVQVPSFVAEPAPAMLIADVRAVAEFAANLTPGLSPSDMLNEVGPQMLGQTWDRVALSLRGGTVLSHMGVDLRADLERWILDNRPLRPPPEPPPLEEDEPEPALSPERLRELAGPDLQSEVNWLFRRMPTSPEAFEVIKRYIEARLAGDTMTQAIANITPDIIGGNYYDLELSQQQQHVTSLTNEIMAAVFGGARYGAAQQQRPLEEVARELEAQGVDPGTIGRQTREMRSASEDENAQEIQLLQEAIKDDLRAGRAPRMADLRELGKLWQKSPLEVLREILEEHRPLFDAGSMREYLADQVGAGFGVNPDNIYAQWLADVTGMSIAEIIEQAQQDFIQRRDEGPGTPHAWRPEEGPPRIGWWVTLDARIPTIDNTGMIESLSADGSLMQVRWLNDTTSNIRSSDRFFRVAVTRHHPEVWEVVDPGSDLQSLPLLATIRTPQWVYLVIDMFADEEEPEPDVSSVETGLAELSARQGAVDEEIRQGLAASEIYQSWTMFFMQHPEWAEWRVPAEERAMLDWVGSSYGAATIALSRALIDIGAPEDVMGNWMVFASDHRPGGNPITELLGPMTPEDEDAADTEAMELVAGMLDEEPEGEDVTDRLRAVAATPEMQALLESMRGMLDHNEQRKAAFEGAVDNWADGVAFAQQNPDMLDELIGMFGAATDNPDGEGFDVSTDESLERIVFSILNAYMTRDDADDIVRVWAQTIVRYFNELMEGL